MFEPQHINACEEDLQGNNGIGRYIFLSGSDQKAQQISQYFENGSVKKHGRQHNLYLGTLQCTDGKLDVAAISSGMGGPSADIIINELILLGARRILRVGTAGSLQPQSIKTGDLIIATAAVRDDKASWDYIYKEYPAIAALEYIVAATRAAKQLKLLNSIHTGIVHTKSSLYAREFNASFMHSNHDYMESLIKAGVMASEMECAQLFILCSLLSQHNKAVNVPKILCGAILAIIGDDSPFSSDQSMIDTAIETSIQLSLETTRQIALIDQDKINLF